MPILPFFLQIFGRDVFRAFALVFPFSEERVYNDDTSKDDEDDGNNLSAVRTSRVLYQVDNLQQWSRHC